MMNDRNVKKMILKQQSYALHSPVLSDKSVSVFKEPEGFWWCQLYLSCVDVEFFKVEIALFLVSALWLCMTPIFKTLWGIFWFFYLKIGHNSYFILDSFGVINCFLYCCVCYVVYLKEWTGFPIKRETVSEWPMISITLLCIVVFKVAITPTHWLLWGVSQNKNVPTNWIISFC